LIEIFAHGAIRQFQDQVYDALEQYQAPLREITGVSTVFLVAELLAKWPIPSWEGSLIFIGTLE